MTYLLGPQISSHLSRHDMTCLSGPQISSHLSRFIFDMAPPKIESFVEKIVVKSLEKPWMSSFRWNACEHAYSSRCARDSRDIAPVRDGVGPVHVIKTHVSCSRNARTLCKSEYAMSLMHHMRPLNRRETHRFRDFRKPRFRLGAVSVRPS